MDFKRLFHNKFAVIKKKYGFKEEITLQPGNVQELKYTGNKIMFIISLDPKDNYISVEVKLKDGVSFFREDVFELLHRISSEYDKKYFAQLYELSKQKGKEKKAYKKILDGYLAACESLIAAYES